MQDVLSLLARMHRPRLLMRAARIGAEDYVREIHLPRALGSAPPSRNSAAILQLLEIEAQLNEQRLSEGSAYNMLSHVEVMIAIVAEAQALRTSLSDLR